MSNCSNMCTQKLLIQWSSTIKIQLSTTTRRKKMPKYACKNATSFWALLANVIPKPSYSIHKLYFFDFIHVLCKKEVFIFIRINVYMCLCITSAIISNRIFNFYFRVSESTQRRKYYIVWSRNIGGIVDHHYLNFLFITNCKVNLSF